MKHPVTVITDAPQSPRDQLRSRKTKYLLMMLLRIVCLVVAAVVVAADVPYAMVWVALCLAGMVLFPWVAVLVANDRPPREEHTMKAFWRRRKGAPQEVENPGPAQLGESRDSQR